MSSLEYMRGTKQIKPLSGLGIRQERVKGAPKRDSITFSLDRSIVEQLRDYCDTEGYFISRVVEMALNKYLKGVEDKDASS